MERGKDLICLWIRDIYLLTVTILMVIAFFSIASQDCTDFRYKLHVNRLLILIKIFNMLNYCIYGRSFKIHFVFNLFICGIVADFTLVKKH